MAKKTISIIMAMLMMAGLLAGCQAEPVDSKSPDNESVVGYNVAVNSEDLPFQKFDEVVEVHIGQSVSATDTLPQGKSVDNNQYTDYLLENYNIKVICDWTAASGNDYEQKVALCIASNTLPDGMAVTRQYMLKAAKSDQLYDIKDLFSQYASPQIKSVMDSTNGRAYEDVTFNDKQVAIPAVEVETGGVQVLNVRQDWLDEYNLKAPETLEDIEKIAQVFLEKKPAGDETIAIAGPDKNGKPYSDFLDAGTTTCGFDLAFSANDAYPGFWLTDESGEVTYGSLSQSTRDTVELMANWYKKGYIDLEMGTRDSTIELINSGAVGMYFGAWWMSGYGTGDAYRNNPDANWQSYPIYTSDKKWNVKMGSTTTGYTIMNKNASEDQVKAMIIMSNALLRDESTFDVSEQPLVFWPIRNLMAPADECEYTYNELIKVLNGETKPEDYAKELSAYKLLADDTSVVKETVPGYEKGKQLTVQDFSMENFGNFQRMYSLLIGDRPYSTTPVEKKVYSAVYSQTETMESKWSNLKSMEEEVMMKIITGKSDISEFDSFVQKWKAEGGDDITKEVKEIM
ncbi:ABC transporter substrate-binding protein [Scatolibacter rhodanostii]|uniref:ABC transporter substrate-binding protein n=1 Tax=Scatolibacter rhodanostii TaxID=2014781 RepID=UPI000C087042|nr:ABC transporter substrate-binding protein [Scatolibacter rhodanostii]